MRLGDSGQAPLLVAGVMSGTSADGIDVALCRIGAGATAEADWELVAHYAYPFAPEIRSAILRAMDAPMISVAELARLSWRLGALYAEAVATATEDAGVTAQLVGCHGQTLYHQAQAREFLGAPVKATWQTGEAAVVAERLRCPVVSDFRPADLVAGGQGAPLVPIFDWAVLGSERVHRVLLNLGGIANVTVLPCGGALAEVTAFDTGPANMVVDALTERIFGRSFDQDGDIAASGTVLQQPLAWAMAHPFFAAEPPKSCGREEFGAAFADQFLEECLRATGTNEDVIATATAFTARSVGAAYQSFVEPRLSAKATVAPAAVEMVASGGGARNRKLLRMLGDSLPRERVRVRRLEDLGVPAEAKEAAAFALLASLTWRGLPGNVPSATGAQRAVVLGKVSFG